ncbi:hypothetical protein CSUI_008341, partial [Cystoisospora suis]
MLERKISRWSRHLYTDVHPRFPPWAGALTCVGHVYAVEGTVSDFA